MARRDSNRESTVSVKLTRRELEILRAWGDQATGGYFGAGAKFVTATEEDVLEKLRAALERINSSR